MPRHIPDGLNISQDYKDTAGYAAQGAIERLERLARAAEREGFVPDRMLSAVWRRAREIAMAAPGADMMDRDDLTARLICVQAALGRRGFDIE